MKFTVDTRFGPATLSVFTHGGIALYYHQPVTINKVLYYSVNVWHEHYGDRLIAKASGNRGALQDLTSAASTVLCTELERLREAYVTKERLQATKREALLHRVASLESDVKEAESKWLKALAQYEAAARELAEHPALDQSAA